MAWVKLDAQSLRFNAAGPEATALYVAAAAWSVGQNTNGFIPKSALRYLAATVGIGPKRAKRVVAALIESGLWAEENETTWDIVDWIIAVGPVMPPRKRQWIKDSVRQEIYDRDGNACIACGSTQRLTLDHILPYTHGGSDDPENLRTLCRSCNSSRGAGRW